MMTHKIHSIKFNILSIFQETEECFESLKLADGGYEYELKSRENTLFPVSLTLPANRTCDACVLR